nr:hypothetical protein [uncultured bacterium]
MRSVATGVKTFDDRIQLPELSEAAPHIRRQSGPASKMSGLWNRDRCPLRDWFVWS